MTDASALSFDEVMALASPYETEVTLVLAGGLAAEAARIAARLDAAARPGASLADGAERAELTKKLEELRELMASAEVTFRFRALPSEDYSNLIAAHPGAPGSGRSMDLVTLQPDLIARCAIEPVMTREQVDRLLDRVNEWQRDRLFDAAWNANNAAVAVPTLRVASVTPSLSDAR